MALAATAYVVAAWSVTPGFYDGIAPLRAYRWVSPPPQYKSGNQAPQEGRGSAAIGSDGRVEPGTVAAKDGQASISFPAGAFVTPADHSAVAVDVRPVDRFPSPGAVHLATNVHCFSSSSPVAAGQFVRITLLFSTQAAAAPQPGPRPGGGCAELFVVLPLVGLRRDVVGCKPLADARSWPAVALASAARPVASVLSGRGGPRLPSATWPPPASTATAISPCTSVDAAASGLSATSAARAAASAARALATVCRVQPAATSSCSTSSSRSWACRSCRWRGREHGAPIQPRSSPTRRHCVLRHATKGCGKRRPVDSPTTHLLDAPFLYRA